jgi:hypothetical protein
VPAVQAALAELMPWLAAEDLSALECFANHRAVLETLPAPLFAALEAAMQDLDLPLALVPCRQMQTWLETNSRTKT